MSVPRAEVSGTMHSNPDAREAVVPKKVLRVPSYYGQIKPHNTLNEIRIHRKIVRVFSDAGFSIEYGGISQPQNPFEIGIHGRSRQFIDYNERYAHIARETGATMPAMYSSPEEILTSPGPLVAKKYGNHQGFGKIFLRTQEDKVKFLTALLMRNPHNALRSKHPERRLEQLMAKIREGKFDDNDFKRLKNGKLTNWITEEYVETPSSNYTSYRIVADATGEIQYGLLLYSSNEKKETDTRRRTIKKDLVEKIVKQREGKEILLTDRNSLLYIDSPSVVSNFAQNGNQIMLNGEKVTDMKRRQILIDHGIDPDNPQIPESLAVLSKKIGRECRLDFPFVEIDFLQHKKGTDAKYYFIEANISPAIDPEDISLDHYETTDFEAKLTLLKKVAIKIAAQFAAFQAENLQPAIQDAPSPAA